MTEVEALEVPEGKVQESVLGEAHQTFELV